MIKRFIQGGTAVLALLASTSAYAQVVDYTGLEELFGEPVTTSATGKPQRISETPVSMEIITSEEIRRSGALDIPQVLRRAAGVDVVRNYKGHADVNVRGFNQAFSNRLLVLVNGRQVYMDNFGMTLWDSFPVQMSEIKQIEVVRGPNTSLFGFNAASGVINIVTFNPLYDDVKNLEVRGGTQEHRQVSGVVTQKLRDDVAVRVSGGRLNSDDYSREKIRPAISSENAVNNNTLNMDGLWKISETSTLRLDAGHNSQESDTTFPYYLFVRTDTSTDHAMVDYSNDTQGAGQWNLKMYHNRLDFDAGVVQSNNLDVVQLSNLFSPFSNHTFRLGVEYRDNRLKGETVGTGKGEFGMNIYSSNAMWDWKINDALSFTNSARVDYWKSKRKGGIAVNDTFLNISAQDANQENTEFSFNSGFLYKASEVSSYRLSVARGLHVPSLDELAVDVGNVPGAEVYGNPNLDTETNTTIELGYNHKLPAQDVTLGANVFYERIQDVILPTVRSLGILGGAGGAEADLTFENVGNASAYGLEFTAKGTLLNKKLYWRADYTYLLSQDDPDGLPDHTMDFSNTQPKHKFGLMAGYTLDKWEFDASARYVSSLDYLATVGDLAAIRRSDRVDDYVSLDTRVAYNLSKNTTISVDGFNLLEEHYERPSYTFVAGVGANNGGSNEIGRTVLLTIRHSF